VAQIVELAAHIHEADEPMVAVGDFNFQPRRSEYQIWTGLSGFRDAAVEAANPQPTVYPGNPMKARSNARRIDYVFVRDGTARGLLATQTRRVFDGPLARDGLAATYSDHAGVLADLEITPPTGRRAFRPDPEAAALARHHLSRARARAERRNSTDRLIAGTGIVAALGAITSLRDPRVTRRKLLSRALQITAVASIPPAVACTIFSAVTNPDELRAHDEIAASLDSVAGDAVV
jgi:hypothetical protein